MCLGYVACFIDCKWAFSCFTTANTNLHLRRNQNVGKPCAMQSLLAPTPEYKMRECKKAKYFISDNLKRPRHQLSARSSKGHLAQAFFWTKFRNIYQLGIGGISSFGPNSLSFSSNPLSFLSNCLSFFLKTLSFPKKLSNFMSLGTIYILKPNYFFITAK